MLNKIGATASHAQTLSQVFQLQMNGAVKQKSTDLFDFWQVYTSQTSVLMQILSLLFLPFSLLATKLSVAAIQEPRITTTLIIQNLILIVH